MATNSNQNSEYLSDQLYTDLLALMQKGEWSLATEKVKVLQEKYKNNPQIDNISNEISFRLSIDSDEIEETISLKIEKKKTTAFTVVKFIGGLIVTFAVISTVSQLIESRIYASEQESLALTKQNDVLLSIENAEKLLSVGLYDDAIAYLEFVQRNDPTNDAIEAIQAEITLQTELNTMYEDAMDMVSEDKIRDALDILYEIQIINSFFKDIDYQIGTLERQHMLFDQLDTGNSFYSTQDWDQAIIHYETFLGLNPDFEEDNVKNKLFDSYIYVIEEVLSRQDLSLEQLQEVEKLYKKSVALRPQDAETIDQRTTIYNSIVELLVNKYIFLARETLLESPDSLENIAAARGHLSSALKINPNSATLHLEFTVLDKYLKGVASYNKGLWDDAIRSIIYVYDADHAYANGTAGQILYESHLEKGKFWLAVGDYLSALESIQQANIVAKEFPEKNLMLFEAQSYLAFVMGRLTEYREASRLYSASIELAEIRNYARNLEEVFLYAIDAAEGNLRLGNYQTAYYFYAEALSGKHDIYTLNEHTITASDYVVLLANQYNSTINYILEYNDLASTNLIRVGQEILIPSLP